MRKSILILVLLFWYLNYTLPFVMDDALYAHIYPETPILDTPHALDIDNEINSFKDVLTSQWNHYFTRKRSRSFGSSNILWIAWKEHL